MSTDKLLRRAVAAAAGALMVLLAQAPAVQAASPIAAASPLAVVEGDGYRVEITDANGKVGDQLDIVLTIRATGDRHVNPQYPHKVKLGQPPAGLELPKPKLVKKDGRLADANTFVFRIPALAHQAGTFAVNGKVKFSVCDDKSCLIKKAKLKATVIAE